MARYIFSEIHLLEIHLLRDTSTPVHQRSVNDLWDDSNEIYFNEIEDPRILEARKTTKTSKYNDDNPSFDTATRGPFQAEFWQAI